ncbi:CHL4-domain-containing protein [Wilcoxina mikolae CBS 423.85]|nr:CHL4-domain-containing protein [Wilcoxina mikolae CBS 423.85]
MVKRKVPSTSLPHSTVILHTRETRRLLNRLSKPALTSIALRWLDPTNVHLYSPKLETEDGDEIPLEAATETYDDFTRAPAIRAKDVAEHMLETEWREGATLLGIAELEWQHLLDHPASSKWQAFLLAPLTNSHTPLRPRFHTPAFLSSLQGALKPMQTAHFFATTHPTLPLTMIRVSLHDPHTPPTYPVRKKMFWLAFPSGGDHVFTNLGASNTDGLRDILMAGIANAVSRAGCRFELKPGRFTAKTLESMCTHRGTEGASGGMAAGWSIYVDGFENSPLAAAKDIAEEEDGEEDAATKKRRKLVAARFGKTSLGDGAAIESAYFEVQEKFPGKEGEATFRPTIGIKLEGKHVYAGIREMAERGEGFVVEKLPGWMVGEEGVSSGIVRDRKVLRKKGDGKFIKA